MKYRSEIKHVITAADRAAICANLRVVAKLDPHVGSRGYYKIRSLYFDSLSDRALREKLDGVNEREKFRIRYYDDNTDFINALAEMTGVNSAVIVSYNGDYMG